MEFIHAGGGDDAAVTVAGVAKDEMGTREPQLLAKAIQEHRPVLGRHRRLVDSIDVVCQIGAVVAQFDGLGSRMRDRFAPWS